MKQAEDCATLEIRELASPSMIYHAHHFMCAECQAAGRLQSGARRCAVGQPLWADYLQSVLAEGVK